MPVATSEVKWMRAQSMNDSSGNGGRMSDSVIASAVRNALFPNITQQQRTDGATLYRKAFIKNTNGSLLSMQDVKIFVENYTPGEGAVLIFPGTQTNVQSAITGSERLYGCGKLDQDTGSDAMSIDVLVEDDAHDIFNNGDMIRISDKETVDGIGNEEYKFIYGEPSYVGNVCTIPLDTPLQNPYAADDTRVSSVYEAADIVATVDEAVVTSDDGTFNDGSHPIVPDNVGTIEQTWTLTFTGAATFAVSGDTVGSVGTGGTGAPFEPENAGAGAPYFTLDNLAFGGTFLSGDTIVFDTHPAAQPIWYKHVVPAGAAVQANDAVVAAVDYES